MDSRLQELLDHHDIRKLLCTYCHGCDRGDAERMAGVYCDDSWDDHGAYKLDGKAFAAMMTMQIAETTQGCSHQLGQSLITVQGDRAGAETYFIATVRDVAKDGQKLLNQLGGRYVDTLQRENGAWKIKKRICVREWSISHRVAEDWLEGAGFVKGERSGNDPSFAVLGFSHSGVPLQADGAPVFSAPMPEKPMQ